MGGRERGLGKTSVLIAYSLGKAQRLLTCLAPLGVTVFVHGAVWNVHQALVGFGGGFAAGSTGGAGHGEGGFRRPGGDRALGCGGIAVDAEVSAVCSGDLQRMDAGAGECAAAKCGCGVCLSDHADWTGLLAAVRGTGAEQVYVTHGFQAALARYLNEAGVSAAEIKTEYGEDEEGGFDERWRRARVMERVSGMGLFSELVVSLGASTKTNDRLEMLVRYFSAANDADKVWVIALFSGRRPKRTVNTTMLWEWCREMTGLPGWLFEKAIMWWGIWRRRSLYCYRRLLGLQAADGGEFGVLSDPVGGIGERRRKGEESVCAALLGGDEQGGTFCIQ